MTVKKQLFHIAALMATALFSHATWAQETIKIGVLQSYSGPSAYQGPTADKTIELFQKLYGSEPGGKKVEFVRRDTTGPNPDVAKRLANELIVREKVRIMIGPEYTPNTLAMASLATEAKIPSIVAGATQGIVGEKSPYYFRTFFTIPQVSRPMAQWAHKNGVKKVVVMVADFAPGHDAESSFSKTFTDLGGTVTSTIRVPLRSPEFSSYMQRIKDAKADAVFVFLPLGELCVQFLKAYSDSGLATSGLKLLGTADITDESHLDATGDTAVGAITSGVYAPALDNPANKKLVEEYERAFGKTQRLNLVNAMIWDSLQVVYAGLEAQRGAPFNPDKFVATLRGRKFDSPRGPFTLDKDNGDIIQNVYIRRVERRNGVLQNVTLETFRDVPTK